MSTTKTTTEEMTMEKAMSNVPATRDEAIEAIVSLDVAPFSEAEREPSLQTVEGRDPATTRDLRAHAEFLVGQIRQLRIDLGRAKNLRDTEAATGALTRAEVDLEETQKRLAKRR